MFGVGPGELVVIMVIALIIFGPEKLPELMRSAGLALREFQRYSAQLQDTLRETQEEFTSAMGVSEVTDAMAGVTDAVQDAVRTVQADAPAAGQPEETRGAGAEAELAPAPPLPATGAPTEYDTAANLLDPPLPLPVEAASAPDAEASAARRRSAGDEQSA